MSSPNTAQSPFSAPAIAVPFHGVELFVVEHSGQPFTAMKPIAEGMGLAWQPQHEKLKSNPRFCVTEIVMQLPGDDQRRAVTCLPLRKLPGWLMTIHPNKVRPEIRDRVIQYQDECDDALWDYWTKGQAIRADFDPERIAASLTPEQREEIVWEFDLDLKERYRRLEDCLDRMDRSGDRLQAILDEEKARRRLPAPQNALKFLPTPVTGRLLLTLEDGRMAGASTVPMSAVVIDPDDPVSLATFVREFVPVDNLPTVLMHAAARLAGRAAKAH